MLNLQDARNQISKYVEFYNTKRLHCTLNYLTSEDYVMGRQEQMLKERETKKSKRAQI